MLPLARQDGPEPLLRLRRKSNRGERGRQDPACTLAPSLPEHGPRPLRLLTFSSDRPAEIPLPTPYRRGPSQTPRKRCRVNGPRRATSGSHVRTGVTCPRGRKPTDGDGSAFAPGVKPEPRLQRRPTPSRGSPDDLTGTPPRACVGTMPTPALLTAGPDFLDQRGGRQEAEWSRCRHQQAPPPQQPRSPSLGLPSRRASRALGGSSIASQSPLRPRRVQHQAVGPTGVG